MSNKVKLTLFFVFAALTFYQFYTFAAKFQLSALFPAYDSSPTSTTLYGAGGVDVAISSSQSRATFDPSIFLLALNITLLLERSELIKRPPLIFALIANLSIAILRVGIVTPVLKRAEATPLNSLQDIWALASLHAQWNAVFLVLATIGSLIVIGLLIHLFRNRRSMNDMHS